MSKTLRPSQLSVRTLDTTGLEHQGERDYGITHTFSLAGLVGRVRITVNSYDFQSHAAVELMSEQRTWTSVLSFDGPNWHENAPLTSQVRATGDRTNAKARKAAAEFVSELADDLLDRATPIFLAIAGLEPSE